jgi:hypothetical protein
MAFGETQILDREYRSAANHLTSIKGCRSKDQPLILRGLVSSRLVSSCFTSRRAGFSTMQTFRLRSARDTPDCCLCRDIEG